jgi:hypothetical protein
MRKGRAIGQARPPATRSSPDTVHAGPPDRGAHIGSERSLHIPHSGDCPRFGDNEFVITDLLPRDRAASAPRAPPPDLRHPPPTDRKNSRGWGDPALSDRPRNPRERNRFLSPWCGRIKENPARCAKKIFCRRSKIFSTVAEYCQMPISVACRLAFAELQRAPRNPLALQYGP